MAKPTTQSGLVAKNKKARFNYELLEKVEAGLKLVGTEVKSLRQGKCSLEEAYVRIDGDDVSVVNMTIPQYEMGNLNNHDATRTRRLLLHKRQIKKLKQSIQEKGLTVVPTRLYFNNRGIAKLEIAIARGKKTHDKRADIKRRQDERDIKRIEKQAF